MVELNNHLKIIMWASNIASLQTQQYFKLQILLLKMQ